jgi:hypothetical protein
MYEQFVEHNYQIESRIEAKFKRIPDSERWINAHVHRKEPWIAILMSWVTLEKWTGHLLVALTKRVEHPAHQMQWWYTEQRRFTSVAAMKNNAA